MTNYSIIGVDGFTSGLAKLFSLMPANEETNLCIFSSNTKKIGTRLYGYTIQEFSSEGLEYMDVIILAIPANQVIKFSIRHQRLFSQKIIVDCSNKLGNGVELQQKLPNSHVVKTLTSINLYTIRDPNYTPRPQGFMPLAGENQQALNIISDMLKYLGYQPQAYASIEFSRYMEHANLKNFPHWTFPITVGGSLVTIFSAYAIVDRNIAYGNPWYGQSIQTLNAGVSCAALALFSLTYSIGPLALIKQ